MVVLVLNTIYDIKDDHHNKAIKELHGKDMVMA